MKGFQRRTVLELVAQIFQLLKEDSPQTLGSLCKELNIVWKQADSYINLITYIQKQPKIKDQKLGARTRILSLEKND
ncbi:MAG: hypothetical protein DRP02_11935 [Candidatus Gerdarchaeota archaeon]|nr:MAG: hypothetical protein DRP02_11935 [Candidatus Gerdarchaeota archaeon]